MAQMQMSFLDDEDVVIAPVKKEEQKKEQKKETKTAKPVAEKKPETIPVPVKVRSGYVADVTLGADAFGGKEAVTLQEVKESICKSFGWLGKPDNLKAALFSGVVIVAVDGDQVLQSGSKIQVSSQRIFCGDRDMSECLDAYDEEAEVRDISQIVLPNSSVQLVKVKGTDNLLALPGAFPILSTVKIPLELNIFTGKKLVITEEDVKRFRDATKTDAEVEHEVEDSDEEEDEDDKVTTAVNKAVENSVISEISAEEAEKVLQNKCSTLLGCGKLYGSKEGKNTVTYTFRVVCPSKEKEYAKPKKETYKVPEDGILIRFLCYSPDAAFRVTSADLGGKNVVDEDDIWPVIHARYSEFSKDACYIASYIESGTFGAVLNVDKKNGSRKGGRYDL